jgi:hypothetical protein
MTGLLLGILLSRVVSGFVAELRLARMFVAAAISIALMAAVLARACRASRRPAPCPIRPC